MISNPATKPTLASFVSGTHVHTKTQLAPLSLSDYEDENSWLPKEFATREEAEAFAKHLNLKPIPETHTYMEWRD